MGDSVNTIIATVAPLFLDPVKKQAGYLFSCKKNVRNMHTNMNTLDASRSDVERRANLNRISNLAIPTGISSWLERVGEVKDEADKISSDDVGSCFNLKTRYKLGRKAFEIIEKIDGLMKENSRFDWTSQMIPLGRVPSLIAPTSPTQSDHHGEEFPSRVGIYRQLLEALEPNHRSRMIALCGMGGVGKTTMMEKLKKAAEEKRMFDLIVKVVIGEEMNTSAVQGAVAVYLGITLTETSEPTRADLLKKSFEGHSDGGKKKILVIVDDIWKTVNLNDIGLSPLPNKGVGFKFLLTSRKRNVCRQMGVEADSVFQVEVLTDPEAQSLFWQSIDHAGDVDPELRKIGDAIVRKCRGLPIAIKVMAGSLMDKEIESWNNALSNLEHYNNDDDIDKVFETSYKELKNNEMKSIFLLCGLYPEDFDIPKEELVRYGWGLKLFDKVYTIRDARNRLHHVIKELIHRNVLIEGHSVGHIRLHDLVRAFVLKKSFEVEQAFHGNMFEWPENDTSDSCKRMSLTPIGMPEIPRDFKYPNLILLRLVHEDEFLKFPHDFYEEMTKLQVIAYERISYPLLPRSLEYSSNLRTLCIYKCNLMFDYSSIGSLSNLEVLCLNNCGIEKLPSTFKNLTKLRLLELTSDVGDLYIDDGVIKNLVKLEELYMCDNHTEYHVNYSELAERSKNLFALEIGFIEKTAQLKNMVLEKLERFNISVGDVHSDDDDHVRRRKRSFENTLRLATNKDEILEYRMNELFVKTEVLHLKKMDGMNDLEDVEVKSLPPRTQSSSFCNLRVLKVYDCAELRYLFSLHVASALTKLEELRISECPVMKTLVHIAENDEAESVTVTLPKLKFLSLKKLPNLLGLCNNVNLKIKLPELEEIHLEELANFTSIYPNNEMVVTSSMNISTIIRPVLNKEVEIPVLKKLRIRNMKNLKEIWPTCREEVIGSSSTLRALYVDGCESLVNLFPCNPMPLLHHLEELEVRRCGCIEVLFEMELLGNHTHTHTYEYEEEEVSSGLRSIKLWELEKLREVWRIKGGDNSSHSLIITAFKAVESLEIRSCERFRNVITATSSSTTAKIDLGALRYIEIEKCGGASGRNDESEDSRQQIGEDDDNFKVAFPTANLINTNFHNLNTLRLTFNEGLETVFEIESPTSSLSVASDSDHNNQQPSLLFPHLTHLRLYNMKKMSDVWKCSNWNEFLILQKQQSSIFHNLTSIGMYECNNITYLFSSLMAGLLFNLKEVYIWQCDSIEEVVLMSNKDDDHHHHEQLGKMTTSTPTSTSSISSLFPHFDILYLRDLEKLKHIDGDVVKGLNNEKQITSTTTPIDDQHEV